MTNSNQKGKRFEREVAAWLREHGYPEARRTAQVDGGLCADVLADGLHVECKHYHKIAVEKFLEQAVGDAAPDEVPVVFMRQNRGEMMVLVYAEDLERLIKTWRRGDR